MKKKKSAIDTYDDAYRVMSINIKRGSCHQKAAKRLTQLARRVSNRANYLMRKDLFSKRKPNQSKIDKLLKRGKLSPSDKKLYNKLPAAVSQRTIQIVGDNFSSFAAAKADYKKSPSKYKKAPKPPKYSSKAKTLYIPCSSFKIADNQLIFAKELGLQPVKLKEGIFRDQKWNPKASRKVVIEVRIVPKGSAFTFEVVYDKHRHSDFLSDNTHSVLLDKSSFISIDLGVHRFAAIASNKAGLNPLLINAGYLRRCNRWYNKRCAKLRSLGKYGHIKTVASKRNRQVKDKLHKMSRYIVDYCCQHDLGKIIIGKNPDWKQGVNIGKKNSQNFVCLPHSVFVSMIQYKARALGIEVVLVDESYTSKASYLDGDHIPDYTKDNANKYTFSGKRIQRGLYRSRNGVTVNSDLNGCGNIARKAGCEGVQLLVAGGGVNPPKLINL